MISLAISIGNEIYRNGLSHILETEKDLTVNVKSDSIKGLYKKIKTDPVDVLLLAPDKKNQDLSSSIIQ